MARGLNRISIIGNLGRDPEVRTTPTNTAVTTFSVAVNERRRDADGNPQETEAQVRENAAAGDGRLSDDVVRALDALWERELRDHPLIW